MNQPTGTSADPFVHLTLKSANKKTGPIPVSTTSNASCPASCPLQGSGCYAESGKLAIHWQKVTKGQRGMGWDEFCETIRLLPEDQAWRHNQAGDLPHTNGEIDHKKALKLAAASHGKAGFTYTHHDPRIGKNAKTLRTMNDIGLTVNLSADTLQEADELALTGLPVVVVLPVDQTWNTTTPAGQRVVVCPATKDEGVTCKSCMLCQSSSRKSIVGFPAHGNAKRKAEIVFYRTKETT